MKNQIKKGFTLIELMIVVAIIGIMASLFIPLVFGGSDGPQPQPNVTTPY